MDGRRGRQLLPLPDTRPGLTVRAVGEDPASAEAPGVNVSTVRYIHVMLGGALAGLGGAYFSLALVPSWQDNPIGQAGWISIALVILASWRPWRALWVAYLFGIAGRLNFTFQTLEINVPATLLAMLPFVLAIIAMIALDERETSTIPWSTGCARDPVLPGRALTRACPGFC